MSQWVNDLLARKQRERADRSRFKALIAAPTAGPLVLPAQARLAFRSISGCVSGTLAAELTGTSVRQLYAPALIPGEQFVLDWAEKGLTIAWEPDFEVFLDMGLGVWVRIAGSGAGFILATGIWNDAGSWMDTATWNDGA